jgi:cyclin C
MCLAVVLKPVQGGPPVHAANVTSALQTLGSSRGGGGPASSIRCNKLADWLAASSVDMEAVVECIQELISLYEVWETYHDKIPKDQIAKFVKARGLDK